MKRRKGGREAPPGPRCYISRPLSGTGQRGWRAKSRRHRGGGGERGSDNLRWWEETEEMMATEGKMPRQRQRRRAPRGPTYMWQKCIRKTDGSHCPASRSTTIPSRLRCTASPCSFLLLPHEAPKRPGGGGGPAGKSTFEPFTPFTPSLSGNNNNNNNKTGRAPESPVEFRDH